MSVPQGRGLRPAQAAQKMSIGLSSLWLKAKNDPDFPQPFKISARTTLFFEREIDEYLSRCAANPDFS